MKEPKALKEKEDKSFTEVIVELMNEKKSKTGNDLLKHFGVLKGDKEYDKIRKDIRKGWAKWQKKFA